jgi:hypothetical protein
MEAQFRLDLSLSRLYVEKGELLLPYHGSFSESPALPGIVGRQKLVSSLAGGLKTGSIPA